MKDGAIYYKEWFFTENETNIRKDAERYTIDQFSEQNILQIVDKERYGLYKNYSSKNERHFNCAKHSFRSLVRSFNLNPDNVIIFRNKSFTN